MLIAKRIADDIVAAFTGVRGVVSTEIAFVSSRRGSPEIYVMGADGTNQRAATANRSLNNFPDWSPDGEAIVYTSYRYKNRPLLFLSTRGHGHPGQLLQKLRGDWSQYRGVYARNGDHLAVVMSQAGSVTDLYSAREDGSDLRQLTKDPAIEVSPSWSPDGKRLAFVSDRTGAPQIYVMNADGSDVRRLTFQGNYNANPAWSPDSRWIAYQTRLEGQFDIWLIDPEGGSGVPLIENPRNDESPAWSPDGRKLAFSSTRRGRADIYVVDATGENLRRLTEGAGENTSPSWGPFSR
jgi:TolB protein